MANSEGTDDGSVRLTIDIVTGVLLAFVAFAGIASGLMISALADRDTISELVADEIIQADGITDAELVELVYGGLLWGGRGLAITGAIVLVGAILFALARLRSHRRGTPHGSVFADAVVGAVVTFVTSFVPFSPLIGGAVAGYLSPGDEWHGVRVGVVVGLLITIPVLTLIIVIGVGFADLDLLWASFTTVFVGVVSIGTTLLFAAAGGYIGGYVRSERGSESTTR